MGEVANILNLDLTPEGKAAIARLDELDGLVIEVGYHEDQVADDGKTPLAAIAYWNHFGTVSDDGSVAIPARPFMDALSKHKDHVMNTARNALANASTAKEVASMIGADAVGIIQKEIVDGKWVPNAPSTIRKKGSAQPLIDTGHMRQQCHFVVKKKGEE